MIIMNAPYYYAYIEGGGTDGREVSCMILKKGNRKGTRTSGADVLLGLFRSEVRGTGKDMYGGVEFPSARKAYGTRD